MLLGNAKTSIVYGSISQYYTPDGPNVWKIFLVLVNGLISISHLGIKSLQMYSC